MAEQTVNQRRRRHAARLRQLAAFLQAKIPTREAANQSVGQLRADISAVLDGADALETLANADRDRD